MLPFRLLLSLMLLAVVAYTGIVIAHHGIGFLPVFLGDIAEMGWPGQFNLDFLCMLVLSALWVAWRHRFSAGGLALGALALVAGAPFLCGYLLVHSVRCRGDVRVLLLGAQAG
jgi:hypothetical protein